MITAIQKIDSEVSPAFSVEIFGKMIDKKNADKIKDNIPVKKLIVAKASSLMMFLI
jgi:hypothetical protein